MAASSMKEKIFQFSMIALIIGAFTILLSVLCLHDWKIYPSKPIPSLILFFRWKKIIDFIMRNLPLICMTMNLRDESTAGIEFKFWGQFWGEFSLDFLCILDYFFILGFPPIPQRTQQPDLRPSGAGDEEGVPGFCLCYFPFDCETKAASETLYTMCSLSGFSGISLTGNGA